MKTDQRIRDPVHDIIKFSVTDKYDPILWALVQTAPMQRLRRIKQLGFSEFVYPGATHTRFSHSVGALQMARRMFNVFERNKVLEHAEDYEQWRAATLAAVLLHDVGHGPYSHVFEEMSETAGIEISHEDYTLKIIDSAEIADILKKSGLYEKVRSFFEDEPPNNSYSAIVSSQLDVNSLAILPP
jgi:hypothetical protein